MRPSLSVVTSRQRLGLSCSDLIRRLQWLIDAGVDLIQIRERDLCDRELTALVRSAVDAACGTPARVVVNDRIDVALAADAAGVHLREDSVPSGRIRAISPPGFLVGCSIHEIERARELPACDYLLFGTVFPSSGKPVGHRVAGVQMLRDVCAAARAPVLAIGGVNVRNAGAAIAAGAAGVAAVESLLAVESAQEASDVVAAFRLAFDAVDRDR